VVGAEPLSNLLARTPRLDAARAARLACALLERAGGGTPGGLRADGVIVDGDVVTALERAAEDAPEYAAPEAALGEPLDARADVYAAGVLLYEMLAGRRPFEGKTRGELLNAHILREPPPLAGVPAALDAVVRRALAKKPGERWPSPAAMRAALEGSGVLAGAPASTIESGGAAAGTDAGGDRHTRRFEPPAAATPPTAAPRPVGPRRHPRLALAVGLLTIATVVGWCALRRGGAPVLEALPGVTGVPEVAVRRLEGAIAHGDLRAARTQAESLARAYPRDGRAFALLGDVLFAEGDKERALAAYREAHHLDHRVGEAPELLANLRATFPDARHGEAAFRLAERIGPPAEPMLSDLAVATTDARLKRRAAEALGRIRQGQGQAAQGESR
jgi:serine/threonine-protein kinase